MDETEELGRIKAILDAERSSIATLDGDIKSPYLKRRLQAASFTLDDVEQFCFRDGLDRPLEALEFARTFINIAVSQRKAVQDMIDKFGPHAIAAPDDLP
jgi:hypothetical protein